MRLRNLAPLLVVAVSCSAEVVTFNPSEIAPATILDVDPFTTQWASFGITGQQMYWYTDSRDSFDTFGVSLNGLTGDILFAVPTPLKIDYWTIGGHSTTYEVFDSSNMLLDSFVVDATGTGDLLGTHTFTGTDISRLELVGNAGFGQISTLYYNTGNTGTVPEPSYIVLLGVAVAAVTFCRRLGHCI